MCSKSKHFLKIFLAKFRIRERLSRKLKNFVSAGRIKLAGGLDYLRLKKYPWISLFLVGGHYLGKVGETGFVVRDFQFHSFR